MRMTASACANNAGEIADAGNLDCPKTTTVKVNDIIQQKTFLITEIELG